MGVLASADAAGVQPRAPADALQPFASPLLAGGARGLRADDDGDVSRALLDDRASAADHLRGGDLSLAHDAGGGRGAGDHRGAGGDVPPGSCDAAGAIARYRRTI